MQDDFASSSELTPNEFDQEIDVIPDENEKSLSQDEGRRDPAGEAEGQDELAVEMMEVEGPISWTEYFC